MTFPPSGARILLLGAIAAALTGGYLLLAQSGGLALLENGPALQHWIQQQGVTGPLTVIGLMMLAIVMSPIPSAPIALAAGAAYGHTEGTIYVLIGAELGAIIAFTLGRLAGLATVQKWLGPRVMQRLQGSQNMLMGIVFVSRLLPFISFDMVSYAAGVTPLRFWRFAAATLAGIIPASFVLAHFGAEMASGESQRIGTALLLLGGVSLLVIIFNWIARRRSRP